MFRCSDCAEMRSCSWYRQEEMLEYDDAQTTRMGTGCCKQKSKLFYDLLRLSPSPIDRLVERAVRWGWELTWMGTWRWMDSGKT